MNGKLRKKTEDYVPFFFLFSVNLQVPMASQLRRSIRINSQCDSDFVRSFQSSRKKTTKTASHTAQKPSLSINGKKRGRPLKVKPIIQQKPQQTENEYLIHDLREMPIISPKKEIETAVSPSVFTNSALTAIYDCLGISNAQPTHIDRNLTEKSNEVSSTQMLNQKNHQSKDNYIEHILSQQTSSDKKSYDAGIQCSIPDVRTIGTSTLQQTEQTIYVSTFDVLDRLFLTNLSHRLHMSADYLIAQAEDLFYNSFNGLHVSEYNDEDIEMNSIESSGDADANNLPPNDSFDGWDLYVPNANLQPNEDMEINFELNNEALFYY